MKPRICFCAESLVWIAKHLKKSARAQFHKMILKQKPKRMTRTINPPINMGGVGVFRSLKDDPDLDLKAIENIRKELKIKRKKRRTLAQKRATKKLIAFNKRRRARR